MKNESKLSDVQILQEVLNALDYNPNSFNTKLDYSSPSTIPHVLKGRNSLSRGIKERIVKAFPNVNLNFLNKGELPVLLPEKAMQAQANLLNIPLNNNMTSSESLVDLKKLAAIPDQLDRIEEMILELIQNKKSSTE
jgi:hypothetical protein